MSIKQNTGLQVEIITLSIITGNMEIEKNKFFKHIYFF